MRLFSLDIESSYEIYQILFLPHFPRKYQQNPHTKIRKNDFYYQKWSDSLD